MAKITKEETRTCTRAEALSIIKNADGKMYYSVCVTAFLPTEGNKGFEGTTFLSVSKRELYKCVASLLSDTLEARGASIRLHMRPADPESAYSRGTISVY